MEQLFSVDNLFKHAFESGAIGVASVGLDGRWLRVNDTLCSLLGYTVEELTALDFQSVTHPDDLEHDLRHVGQVLAGEIPSYSIEKRYLNKNGEAVWVLLNVTLIRQSDGSPYFFISQVQDISAKKRIEAERDTFFAVSADMLAIIDRDGRFQQASAAWTAVLGWERDELIGHRFVEFLHADDVERTLAEAERSFRGESTQGFCNRYMTKDGNVRWLEWAGKPGPEGNLFCSARDVSKRRLSEEILRLQERAINSATDGIIITDVSQPDNPVVYCNQAFEQISGYSATDMYGRSCRFMQGEDRDQPVLDELRAAVRAGEGCQIVLRNYRKDGSLFLNQLTLSPVPDEAGRISHYIGIVKDITDVEQKRIAAVTQHAFQTALIDSFAEMGEGIAVLEQGRIGYVNEALCQLAGYTESELLSLPSFFPLVHPDEIEKVRLNKQMRDAGHPVASRYETAILHKDGRRIDVDIAVTRFTHNNRVSVMIALRDITSRNTARAALHAQKEHFQVTLEAISDAVISTDIYGKVTYLNPVAEKLTGWKNAEALGQPLSRVFLILNGKTRAPATNPVESVLRNGRTGDVEPDTVLIRRDKVEFAIDDSAAPIRNQQGEVIGVVLVFKDVTQERLLAEQIAYQSKHDTLTGLINRVEFESRLDVTLEKESQQGKGHALLYVDLDQFKLLNDTCGHVAGDHFLVQVAVLFQSRLRETDTIARLGGDEFAIILENCPIEAAVRVAESLRRVVSEFKFIWEDKSFSSGASIGLVAFDRSDLTRSEVMRAADVACYIAKDKGRNRVHIFAADDHEFTKRQGEMSWISRIQKALQEDRFVLYAQRIAPLNNDETTPHYELLIRMVDEQKQLVPPMAFIPAAERYNQMQAIDRWVIQNALAYLSDLRQRDHADVHLSINLSGASLNDDALLDFIRDQFTHYKVPYDAVCFEVTETTAIANLTQVSRLIRELKADGCRFSLDDFGSGMSSFAYLKHLPVDYLKIDGGFVKGIPHDPIDRAMVEAINNIGHVMGIMTVAEFVENGEISAMLIAIGVDYAQGYGIAKPCPLSDIHHPLRVQ